ncbi:riboflavin synthase subunit alpha [Bacterioplanes sanyensis]|jgi:riboflavin synthase|uniref:riboflavin synthase n=1 Tax=Bacterioplanes sanyensis TaxID=1249553 RepID=UPI001679E556|nr:riboflavin synthase [Bacterioplanes sanyensis]GGY54639.1 riboflavin synthase subunit alpha [Bacterioplanes sanyensis]
MFTGIIEAIGQVASVEPRQGDVRLRIDSGALDLADVRLGDSIATNGVCLTVVELPGNGFVADVSRESLQHTLIGQWQSGDTVNLEKALTPSTRMGGHIVTGHVDGVGTVRERQADARSIRLTVEPPAELCKYIAGKGSITVDGISLTANAVHERGFELNIVPHTAEQTTLFHARVGQQVHLEVDIIARYLEQLLSGGNSHDAGSRLSPAFLAEHGFWK